MIAEAEQAALAAGARAMAEADQRVETLLEQARVHVFSA